MGLSEFMSRPFREGPGIDELAHGDWTHLQFACDGGNTFALLIVFHHLLIPRLTPQASDSRSSHLAATALFLVTSTNCHSRGFLPLLECGMGSVHNALHHLVHIVEDMVTIQHLLGLWAPSAAPRIYSLERSRLMNSTPECSTSHWRRVSAVRSVSRSMGR